MTPSPDVHVCADCGWAEFSIPESWLAAGWLRQKAVPEPAVIAANYMPAVVM